MDDLRSRLESALADHYIFERELGGGGMSRTYLAREKALDRRVVVKVLAPELLAGISVERFRREVLLAAKLQHPHVVPVLAAGDVDGLPWFTMPYVDGDSLRHRLAKGPLGISEAVSILRDVARALAYAHAQGIVHRDIKPDNVLLSTGSATVTDFGIAKAISAARTTGDGKQSTMLTVAGTSIGTPTYMAPEQAAGDPEHRFARRPLLVRRDGVRTARRPAAVPRPHAGATARRADGRDAEGHPRAAPRLPGAARRARDALPREGAGAPAAAGDRPRARARHDHVERRRGRGAVDPRGRTHPARQGARDLGRGRPHSWRSPRGRRRR